MAQLIAYGRLHLTTLFPDLRQLGNNPVDRRTELGVEVYENGVSVKFDARSNLPKTRLFGPKFSGRRVRAGCRWMRGMPE